jgi:hypothetical protein
MTNKTFEPVGLLEITKQLKTNRKSVDDLEDRLHSALDAKRDVASDYSRQLQDTIKHNDAMWKSGYDVGYAEGYKEGVGLANKIETRINAMTEDEVSQELVRGGISVEDQDQLLDDVAKMIEDKDEDEPDQYQPEPEKWGGTK